ncbi:unnamed protein product (macronuclear) [Paramecium tetraurelia]|uniref:PPM-type phosphatase domain-containing protein n=1 Tax=Paramecium tetraurelia TaxID=5888 RepID=A0BQ69_PARTE|nr:uncharacterized protein GSPATT00005437001 [Paramecium tetraurelia]CAK60686.1 unnamed protein product [Paramecium tetraurelia]|eukprot:XP_001428084.1 hypothetical protein (macronuclear) [Paramecium tetraurelia strain d4-2]
MKLNSASQQKLANARPCTSTQKTGSSPIKNNKYLVSTSISTAPKTDNKILKSIALSRDFISSNKSGTNSYINNQLLDKKSNFRSQFILDINDANSKKNRPSSRLQMQRLVKNNNVENNLKYHENLIQKQFKKLLGLQKQTQNLHKSPPQIHNRAMSNGDLKPTSDIANKLIEYIKKQSAKQIKGYRSISNPDIIQTDRRLISKFAVKTQAGMLYTKQEKVNQDSYAIHERIGDIDNSYLLQVSDGHGVNGHEVAQFVQEKLPNIIDQLLKSHKLGKKDQDMMIQVILRQAFERTTKELYQSGIDITYSGATTVCLLVIKHTGWCANIGDSRAIIGRQKDGLHVIELSHDQKPDLPKEQKRILQNGGRVQAYSDEEGNPIGPARVWLKNENVPGLAMSRSFGDYVAAQVGVISIPEIIKHTFQNDKFLIIASDGIWEFLDNQWIIDTVFGYYLKNDAEGAVDKLVKEATESWKKEEEVIDDITCIVAFLN